jgi:hypothetical protein
MTRRMSDLRRCTARLSLHALTCIFCRSSSFSLLLRLLMMPELVFIKLASVSSSGGQAEGSRGSLRAGGEGAKR